MSMDVRPLEWSMTMVMPEMVNDDGEMPRSETVENSPE